MSVLKTTQERTVFVVGRELDWIGPAVVVKGMIAVSFEDFAPGFVDLVIDEVG